MTTPEQRELAHLRRLVAAYQDIVRDAWRPVETTWAQVRTGDLVLSRTGVTYVVDRERDTAYGGGHTRTIEATPEYTVRVLAPIPSDMTDLLLASELGAACARVDEEA